MVVFPFYVVFRKPSEKDKGRLVSSPLIPLDNAKRKTD